LGASEAKKMMTIPHQLAPLLNTVPAWALLLSMLVVSLVLIFAGRAVVKVVAFFAVGLIGASIGGSLAAQYLVGSGSLGVLLGVILGFVLGGMIGVVAVMIGIGVILGYGAYILAGQFVSGYTIPLVVGFVFFLVGIALYNKILGLVTAVAGAFLLFDVLTTYGFDPTLSMVLAGAAALAGIWVQEGLGRKRMTQPTVSNVGGQPSDHN
jgi:ABC-type antimicrobial peptide transport system permease subunit